MRNEFERLAARQPLELLSMKRSTQSTLLHIAKKVLLKNIANIQSHIQFERDAFKPSLS